MTVTFVWWCAAGTLIIISAVLYRRMLTILIAASPARRVPWVGWPANTPRSAKVLQGLAVVPLVCAAQCVYHALGERQLYDYLAGWALALIAPVVGLAVSQAKHNRRIRRAA